MNNLNNDYPFSKIALGTWRMGGDVKVNPQNDDEKDIAAIRYAIDNGITHIDTSESYAGGQSEKIIGEAIKVFPREKVFIATKVREYNLSYENVIKSCEHSLERLNTPYIDLYYIHKQNPSIPIEETAKALNELLERGLIKHIGLSNVGVETIKKFSSLLNKPIFAVQNQYNIVCRESRTKGVIDYCRENNIKFIAWRPILLSFPGSKDNMYSPGTYEILDKMAMKYGKTNVQIVVKWLLQQKNISLVFKSSNKQHIQEILESKDFNLTPEDWHILDTEFPVQINTGCTADVYFEIS